MRHLQILGLRMFQDAERSGFVVFLPILLGMSVGNLIPTYAPVYLHGGLGWLPSVTLVLVERKADRYVHGFVESVVGHFASFCAFESTAEAQPRLSF